MKKVLLLSLLFGFLNSYSQVLLNPHPVSGFQVSSNDILSFDVINTSVTEKPEDGVLVYFKIDVKQEGYAGNILEMKSSTHFIKKGVTNFNLSNINIIDKRYATPEIANYELKMRSFPIGSYTYCVSIICQDKVDICKKYFIQENQERQCSEFTILPLTPLLLSLPEDEDILKVKRPNFNWIPPMPLGNDPNISYELTLVHLNKDQKGEDGIRRNRPLYKRDGIKSINMTFPTTLEDLEDGEHYAWQVQAYLGKILAATSEVWEFEIEKKLEFINAVNLNKGVKGTHTCTDALNLQYSSERPGLLSYIVTNSNGNIVTPSVDIMLDRGSNLITIPADKIEYKVGETLRLEVIDEKNRSFKINFKFSE
jgi:hypothetical protein